MNNYKRGRNFEYRVKRFFEDNGYFVVRSAGSHGLADLVCLKRKNPEDATRVVLIQCKYGSGKMSKEEINEFDELCKELYTCGYIALIDKKGHLKFRLIRDIDDEERNILEKEK